MESNLKKKMVSIDFFSFNFPFLLWFRGVILGILLGISMQWFQMASPPAVKWVEVWGIAEWIINSCRDVSNLATKLNCNYEKHLNSIQS